MQCDLLSQETQIHDLRGPKCLLAGGSLSSGLQQVKVFIEEDYLANWIQVFVIFFISFFFFGYSSYARFYFVTLRCCLMFWCSAQALFNSLPPDDYINGVLVLGGDGRYFNCEAAQVG
ncbi:OLC1v1030964C1 [Oldenlandia corymbosa var. corymbosa]|uniref:OLC1v1030964C1 n=1 Tax=Oldenlandia corymbosa var. corymbosa TaxID=529605 RepID=A0AAV1CJ43_OLDCO|nr:OLC1v1030964C1 [Oldenlandia corymbosa var. corymbosa]